MPNFPVLSTSLIWCAQVRGGEEAAAALAPEDEAEFAVVANRRTGGFRAEDVQLLCKAQHRRELGQVHAQYCRPSVMQIYSKEAVRACL